MTQKLEKIDAQMWQFNLISNAAIAEHSQQQQTLCELATNFYACLKQIESIAPESLTPIQTKLEVLSAAQTGLKESETNREPADGTELGTSNAFELTAKRLMTEIASIRADFSNLAREVVEMRETSLNQLNK